MDPEIDSARCTAVAVAACTRLLYNVYVVRLSGSSALQKECPISAAQAPIPILPCVRSQSDNIESMLEEAVSIELPDSRISKQTPVVDRRTDRPHSTSVHSSH